MIAQDDAVAIARARAMENGWALPEPLYIIQRRGWLGQIRSYRIESNPALLGAKARFTIDAKTGSILDEGYLPR